MKKRKGFVGNSSGSSFIARGPIDMVEKQRGKRDVVVASAEELQAYYVERYGMERFEDIIEHRDIYDRYRHDMIALKNDIGFFEGYAEYDGMEQVHDLLVGFGFEMEWEY